MDRRRFLLAGTAAFASAFSRMRPAGAVARERARPNILLILADDLGYGHLGCYGQEFIKTPNIDQLAHEGARFTQAYAGCPQCAPSRSVLMTGLHSGHTTVRGNTGGIPLRDEDFTVAEMLRQSGYRTGLFGKWGLGDADSSGTPNKQGFDEFFGYLHQRHAQFYYTDYLWENDQRYLIPENRNGRQMRYSHDIIVEKGLEWMRRPSEKPFFCFMSFAIPHFEWVVPDESLRAYAGKFPEVRPPHHWRPGYHTPDEPKATLAAMISHMDDSVGRLMLQLDAMGARDNTLVIFTSDNGADSHSLANAEFFRASGNLRGYKYDLYEGGIRVPAIANWKGTIKGGAEIDVPWHFADIMPTFAELAGYGNLDPRSVDGISVVELLLGGEREFSAAHTERFLYWETESGSRAGRLGDWKAVQPSKDASVELYDLSADVGETRNLASDHPEIVERLSTLMDANHTEPLPQIEPVALDGRQYR